MLASPLPPKAEVFWAKSDDADGHYTPVYRHALDTAEVLREFYRTHLTGSRRERFEAYAGSPELAEKVFAFLGALHDIGKISPVFQAVFTPGRERVADAGYDFGDFTSRRVARAVRYRHEVGSYLAVRSYLTDRHGWPQRRARDWAAVLCGHHGVFHDDKVMRDYRNVRPNPLGDSTWADARQAHIEFLRTEIGLTDDDFAALRDRIFDIPLAVEATGAVIISDWIASDDNIVPLTSSPTASSQERARTAMRTLNLPSPWQPQSLSGADLYSARFGLTRLRPMQQELVQMAEQTTEPEMYVVQAPTGEGKTAAALAAAEILADRHGLGGLIFALPTRATTDAVFSGAILPWLTTATGDSKVSLRLMHGGANSNSEFAALTRISGVHSEDSGDECCTGGIVAHQFLSRRKLALVSSIVVSTVDHLLMSALASRHVVLRHLGLAGKVVIIDEVHAYDRYMLVFLERALTWLGSHGVPVIALSATVPPALLDRLLNAYNAGKGRIRLLDIDRITSEPGSYPAISHTAPAGPDGAFTRTVTLPASSRRSVVRVREQVGTPVQIADAALHAARDGGRVALIFNTVLRAQEAMTHILDVLGDDAPAVLLHSRLISPDRRRREDAVIGSAGPASRVAEDTRIVVSTQVIEQSLDLDFDTMFSDIAPIDLLLQRMGRLHRHDRPEHERPARLREPVMHICGVTRIPGTTPRIEPGSVAVYGEWILLRTLDVLDRHLVVSDGVVSSPLDVQYLVGATYAGIDAKQAPSSPAGWDRDHWIACHSDNLKKEASRRHRAEQSLVGFPSQREGLNGWATPQTPETGTGDHRGLSHVRDADDALEVVVVQRLGNGEVVGSRWSGSARGYRAEDAAHDPDLARRLAQDTLRLPASLSRNHKEYQLIGDLEQEPVAVAWQQSKWLRGTLPLVLDENGCATVAGKNLYYDDQLGLIVGAHPRAPRIESKTDSAVLGGWKEEQ